MCLEHSVTKIRGENSVSASESASALIQTYNK